MMEPHLPAATINDVVNTDMDDRLISRYIPQYLLPSQQVYGTKKAKLFFKIAFFILKPLAILILRPRGGKVGDLGQEEVEKVYSKEAKKYNNKHHLTTRGMDLVWRNWTAQSVCNIALHHKKKELKLLDLCTGTGLTLKCIYSQLKDWSIKMELTGLDYNEEMLKIARHQLAAFDNVALVKGDATMLVNNSSAEHQSFQPFQFDIVTQMFGIGGIHKPLTNIREVLKVLRVGGEYLMVDMHQPVKSQPGELFMFGRFFSLPYFEQEAYKKLILPIALNRLWGWRDTTWLFYLAPLITCKGAESNEYYSFSTSHFEFENQRWIFSLPLMPVAKIKLKKESITASEARERALMLDKIIGLFNLKSA